MAMQELAKYTLAEAIRGQVGLNQIRGDRESYHGMQWDDYGRDIADYEFSFSGVLQKNSIKDLLRDKENLVVIDLMAPSKTVSSLFKQLPDKSKLGIAVSLEDLRPVEETESDTKLNVVQIAGDIMKLSTWDKVRKQLQGRKADLIMERALCGLGCLVPSPRLYSRLLNEAWGFLSENNGILIAEVPYVFGSEAKKLINVLRNDHNMDASIGKSEGIGRYSIKIIKTPKSPEKLLCGDGQ
jgi:hypothetical protein